MAISALFVGPIEPKKIYFCYKPIGMPPIPFWRLETAKKGISIAFLLFRIIKFGFLAFLEAKMTKIDILNPKLIVPNDYQQFCVHFEWFLALFHISDEKWLLS